MKPLIAVTGGKPSVSSRLVSCPPDYLDAISDASGDPVRMQYSSDEGTIRVALKKCSGLMLTGGGDIDPSLYGQLRHKQTKGVKRERDAMEIAAISIAIEMNLPILGICRGAQVLNVAFCGTLIQDIPTQVKGAAVHSRRSYPPPIEQAILIEPGSLLARVLGTDRVQVNSRHHQAVGALGDGLRISARAEDGMIEAIESDCGLPILAVQFHPENIYRDNPILSKLFDWLIIEASKYNP